MYVTTLRRKKEQILPLKGRNSHYVMTILCAAGATMYAQDTKITSYDVIYTLCSANDVLSQNIDSRFCGIVSSYSI